MKKILIILFIIPLFSKAQIALKLDNFTGGFYGDAGVYFSNESHLGIKGHTVFPGLQWEIKGAYGSSINAPVYDTKYRFYSFGAGYHYLFGRKIYGSNYWSFYFGMNLLVLNNGQSVFPYVVPETGLTYNIRLKRNIYVQASARTLASFEVGNMSLGLGITKYLRRNSRKF